MVYTVCMTINRRDHWSSQAKCAGLTPELSDTIFFDPKPGRPSRNAPWSKYCGNCPVCKECFEWAMVHNVEGIWGNTTKSQRDHPFLAEYRKNLKEQAEREGWLEKYPKFVGYKILTNESEEFHFEFEEDFVVSPDTVAVFETPEEELLGEAL